MKCIIEGCESESKARGLCNKHWYRWYRNGDPEKVQAKRFPPNATFRQHLFNRIERQGDCWVWIGAKRTFGYGDVTINGERFAAHRLAWTVFRGAIPEGMNVLHKCDNPACVNPRHLFLGTQRDNIRDMHLKERANFGLPPTLNRGEAHGMSKLKKEDVLAIRKSEASAKSLAGKYGVHIQTIYEIRSRKSWRHI